MQFVPFGNKEQVASADKGPDRQDEPPPVTVAPDEDTDGGEGLELSTPTMAISRRPSDSVRMAKPKQPSAPANESTNSVPVAKPVGMGGAMSKITLPDSHSTTSSTTQFIIQSTNDAGKSSGRLSAANYIPTPPPVTKDQPLQETLYLKRPGREETETESNFDEDTEDLLLEDLMEDTDEDVFDDEFLDEEFEDEMPEEAEAADLPAPDDKKRSGFIPLLLALAAASVGVYALVVSYRNNMKGTQYLPPPRHLEWTTSRQTQMKARDSAAREVPQTPRPPAITSPPRIKRIYFRPRYKGDAPIPFQNGMLLQADEFIGRYILCVETIPEDVGQVIFSRGNRTLQVEHNKPYNLNDSDDIVFDSGRNALTISVNHQDKQTNADIHFTIQGKPSLDAEFFGDERLGKIKHCQKVWHVFHQWGKTRRPPKCRADKFSARWTGKIRVPRSGKYTFTVFSDDGFRMKIGDNDMWGKWEPGVHNMQKAYDLKTGEQYRFVMEYYNERLDAQIRLYWSGPEIPRQLVPPSAFSAD